jgi:hypothetical protein
MPQSEVYPRFAALLAVLNSLCSAGQAVYRKSPHRELRAPGALSSAPGRPKSQNLFACRPPTPRLAVAVAN